MAKQKANTSQLNSVSFKACVNVSNLTVAGGTKDIIYDAKYYDNTNSYSTATGLFTAPVSGVYSFVANSWTETTALGRGFLSPRGTSTTAPVNGGFNERSMDTDATGSYVRRVNGSWQGYMQAGQTFGMAIYTSTQQQLNASGSTTFAGYLVGAL